MSLTQHNNIIKGLVPECIGNGVAILQYADDTTPWHCAFKRARSIYAVDLNKVPPLYACMKKMFGLKINLSKSEVVVVSQDNSKMIEFPGMFDG